MARHTPPPERSAARTVSPGTYRRITLAVLVTQVAIVLTGAAVRLTGSGLGCSDWPSCEQDQFVPAGEYNAVVEFVNRTVSLPVLIAVVLAVWAAGRRVPFRPELRRLSWGLVGGVLAQVLLGAVVVRLDLLPSTVIVHFLVSMVLLLFAVALHHRAGEDLPRSGPGRQWTPTASPRLVLPLGALSALVLIAGTVVTGAGPHGGDETAERLPVYLPSATRIHSLAAWVFLALLVVTLVVLRRERAPQALLRSGSLVVGACLVQGAIGYLQYWNGVPPLLVFVHIVGAMTVWCTTIWFVLEHRRLAGVVTARTDPAPIATSTAAGEGQP